MYYSLYKTDRLPLGVSDQCVVIIVFYKIFYIINILCYIIIYDIFY